MATKEEESVFANIENVVITLILILLDMDDCHRPATQDLHKVRLQNPPILLDGCLTDLTHLFCLSECFRNSAEDRARFQ